MENTDIEKLNLDQKNKLFYNNFNLLNNYFNNKNILLTYLRLSENLNKNDWIVFLNYWLNSKDDLNNIKLKLDNFKVTQDKELSTLIEKIKNRI